MHSWVKGRVLIFIDKDPDKLERGWAWVATSEKTAKDFQLEATGIKFRHTKRQLFSTRSIVEQNGNLIQQKFGPYKSYLVAFPPANSPRKKFTVNVNSFEFSIWTQKSLTNKALLAWLRTWAPSDTEILTPTNRTISLNSKLIASRNSCYVYFILNRESNAVKIGKAQNVGRRLGSLQTASPTELELLHKIRLNSENNAAEEEYRLHQKFKRLNIRGEWFHYDPLLQKYIDSLKSN